MAVKDAPGGIAAFPSGSDPSITAQSGLLGDPIAPGSTRWYPTWYRDANAAFCTSALWNVTSGVRITW